MLSGRFAFSAFLIVFLVPIGWRNTSRPSHAQSSCLRNINTFMHTYLVKCSVIFSIKSRQLIQEIDVLLLGVFARRSQSQFYVSFSQVIACRKNLNRSNIFGSPDQFFCVKLHFREWKSFARTFPVGNNATVREITATKQH